MTFDLDKFINNSSISNKEELSSSDNAIFSTPGSGTAGWSHNGIPQELQYIEQDIPDNMIEKIQNILPDTAPARYIHGLCLLKQNQHNFALTEFDSIIKMFPQAINPRMYYIITSLENPPEKNSLIAHYREFHLKILSLGLNNPFNQQLTDLLSALVSTQAGERFIATTKISQLDEEIPPGFHLADLLIIKTLAELGRNEMTVPLVEKRMNYIKAKYPRISKIPNLHIYSFYMPSKKK